MLIWNERPRLGRSRVERARLRLSDHGKPLGRLEIISVFSLDNLADSVTFVGERVFSYDQVREPQVILIATNLFKNQTLLTKPIQPFGEDYR